MNYFIQANSEKEYIKIINEQLKADGMRINEKKELWVYNEMDGREYKAGKLILKPNSQPYLKLEPDKINEKESKVINKNYKKKITNII